jgi:nitrite reductase/ring-hydroxylating ferredoxin subunit
MATNNFMRWITISLAPLVILTLSTCSPNLSDDPIPYLPFPTLTINTNLPEYTKLRTQGFQAIDDIGVKGVIVYRVNSGTYVAYERNCSYKPLDACATVGIDASNLFMVDYCCSSKFDFATGNPIGGPAWRPLQKYETSFTGSSLTITDQIVQ